MSSGKPITQVAPGEAIDLEGVDESGPNERIWPFEYASVESVSTLASPAGGWLDGCLGSDIAIVYVHNGAVPAVVPIDSVVTMMPV